MSNACEYEETQRTGQGVPLFDLYAPIFSTCDNFNRSLHDRTFPGKKGGYNRKGDQGAIYDFIFSSILHNTFEYYNDFRNIPSSETDFKKDCIELANDLWLYGDNLNN